MFAQSLRIAATAAFGLVAVAAAVDQVLSFRTATYVTYVHHPERMIGAEAGWVSLRAMRGRIHLQVVRTLFEVQPPSPVGEYVPPWRLPRKFKAAQSPKRWRFDRARHDIRRHLNLYVESKPSLTGWGFLLAFEILKESGAYTHAWRPGVATSDLRITGPDAEANKHCWWLFDLIVPHWFVALLSGALAWLASRPLRAERNARRRARRGECPACGYDRRGSPGRPCPECGAVASPAAQGASA
jgi:hypothetical protein